MFNNKILLACSTAFLLLLAHNAHATLVYTFDDETAFDNKELSDNASMTEIDSPTGISVTLSTIDIIGQDGTLASSGDPDTAHKTNIGGSGGLGINSDINGPWSGEATNFNPGEAWEFSFDVDVRLIEIDFAGQGEGTQMTMSSSAFTSLVLDDGQTDDIFTLANTFVPANTIIRLEFTDYDEITVDADDSIRITTFTVAAIPEPGSFLMAGSFAMLAFGGFRGRRALLR